MSIHQHRHSEPTVAHRQPDFSAGAQHGAFTLAAQQLLPGKPAERGRTPGSRHWTERSGRHQAGSPRAPDTGLKAGHLRQDLAPTVPIALCTHLGSLRRVLMPS